MTDLALSKIALRVLRRVTSMSYHAARGYELNGIWVTAREWRAVQRAFDRAALKEAAS